MIQKSANVWATMNRTSLHTYRMDLINHMETVLKKGLTEKYGEGRGIVMVAGNADTLMRVKWSLMMLRSYESTLPVQIVSAPSVPLFCSCLSLALPSPALTCRHGSFPQLSSTSACTAKKTVSTLLAKCQKAIYARTELTNTVPLPIGIASTRRSDPKRV